MPVAVGVLPGAAAALAFAVGAAALALTRRGG
jgi:hypothetical protein